MAIRFVTAAVRAKNMANINAVNRSNLKNATFPLFTTIENASWAAQITLAEASYPLSAVTLVLGRKAFQLRPGDLFRLTYSPYGIDDMVMRVLAVEEESLETEKLIVTAVEDVYYATNLAYLVGAEGTPSQVTHAVEAFVNLTFREPPYVIQEFPSTIIPIIGRVTETEIGARVYLSIDAGTTYNVLGTIGTFSVHGTLVTPLDDVGTSATSGDDSDFFDVYIPIDADQLQSDAAAHEKLRNLILIGTEIISFTTIEPIPEAGTSGTSVPGTSSDDDLYRISGLLRGVYDTTPAEHSGDDEMWSLDGLNMLQSTLLQPGNTYYFKAIPFSNSNIGELSEALEKTLDFRDWSTCPRPVTNLLANGESTGVIYGHSSGDADIVLTWDPQVRWDDDIPSNLWDADGLFEVEVWAGSVLLREVKTDDSNLMFNTFTYTEEMNYDDGSSGTLASELTFIVYNYIDQYRYSDAVSITVSLAST